MMTGKQFKAWRQRHNLSANEMAKIIGWTDGSNVRRTDRQPVIPKHVSNFVEALDFCGSVVCAKVLNHLIERTE